MDSPLPKLPTADEDFLGWLERQAAEDVIYSAADLFPQAIEYARSCEKEITQLRADLTAAQTESRGLRSALRKYVAANNLEIEIGQDWRTDRAYREAIQAARAVLAAPKEEQG